MSSKHSNLDHNVCWLYVSKILNANISYSKGDIDVQKIKVENAFFCILGYVTCLSLYLLL